MSEVVERLMTEAEREQYGGPPIEWLTPGTGGYSGCVVRVRQQGLAWSYDLDAAMGHPERVRIGWDPRARALILRVADADDPRGWRVQRNRRTREVPHLKSEGLARWLAVRVEPGTYAAVQEPVGWVVRVQAAAAPGPADAAPPRPAKDASPAESWTDRVRAWARAHGGLVHVADAVEVFGQAWPESEAAAKHRLLALLAKLGAERVARGTYRLRGAVDA
jgi:hypothetical protein